MSLRPLAALASALSLGMAVLLAPAASAQPAGAGQPAWPTRGIRLISPYGAGGSNDFAARVVAERLSKRLGQPVTVENKPGAGTRLANEQVARAAPDGYTLLWAAAPLALGEALYQKLPYDLKKDFAPVALGIIGPVFLVVNADAGVRTVADFVAMARAKKEGVNFGSPGAGSGPHLTAALFAQVGKFEATNVHHRGDATAYVELLAGRMDATLTAVTSALPHIRAGKLRVLAVASEERSPIYPEAPTFREAGFPAVVGYGWFGMVAPAATPRPIVERLAGELNAILAEPEVRAKLHEAGLQPAAANGPKAFSDFIDAEVVKWTEVARAAKIEREP